MCTNVIQLILYTSSLCHTAVHFVYQILPGTSNLEHIPTSLIDILLYFCLFLTASVSQKDISFHSSIMFVNIIETSLEKWGPTG